jgi:predicted nucleic acid-binding protein
VAATHLADTSALLQLHQPGVAVRLGGLVVAGLVATSAVVDLELIARFPAADRAAVAAERRFFERIACDDAVLDRALAVQGQLEDPLPSVTELVVAATAELAGLVLIHDDDVFDRIAALTGQPVERVTVA